MITHLPHPTDRYDAKNARQFVEEVQRAFVPVLSTVTASPFLLLTSPDDSVWKITVSDVGTLAAVKIPKGRPL